MECTCTAQWADLPLDLLGGIIGHLTFPGDRARFAAVCRAWRSAVHEHRASHLPWIVFPSGAFCIAGDGAVRRIPGFPDDGATTCLGAAHDGCWLALDRTDDVVRRTTYRDRWCKVTGEPLVYPRRNVKHKHAYMLYNAFNNITVPLPELDAAVGHVAETFNVRKVLMRSPAPDDVIAVTTNNSNYNIVLCRPGKGTLVLPFYRIIDVAFLGDTLYGITSGEELLAFHLGEDEDGRPNVTKIELVIKNPLSRYYYHEFRPWYWPQDVVDINDQDVDQDDDNDSDEDQLSNSNEENGDSDDDVEEPNQEENDDDTEEGYYDEEFDDDELADQASEDIFNDDDMVSINIESEEYGEAFDMHDEEVPYEPKDEILIRRYLVKSQSGELLLARHRYLSSPHSDNYTLNVEVLKADLNERKWAPCSTLAKDEAIFLGQSNNKCIQARGDISEGFVYCITHLEGAYDMTCCTTRDITSLWPRQCTLEDHSLITWLFPPEVVV